MAFDLNLFHFKRCSFFRILVPLAGVFILGISYSSFNLDTSMMWQHFAENDIDGQFFEKSVHESQEERGQILLARRFRMLSACREFNLKEPKYKQIFYDENSNSLYCAIPKIGSSFWKRIFYAMVTGKNSSPLSVPSTKIHTLISRMSLKGVDNAQKYMRIVGATKFMFTRDPYHRLFSAYTDKLFLYTFETPGITKSITSRLRMANSSREFLISARQRKSSCNDNQRMSSSHRNSLKADSSQENSKWTMFNITFSEALQYATGKGEFANMETNVHFSPIHDICNPCFVGYDFIGKMETFKDDTSFILAFLNRSQVMESIENVDTSNEMGMLTDVVIRTYKMIDILGFEGDARDIVFRRLWKTFQFRGLLSDHIPYSLSVNVSSTITSPNMIEVVMGAYNKSGDRSKRLLQREKYYHQAFRSVPLHVLKAFRDSVQMDCKVFGYDLEPADIFDGRIEGDEENNIFSNDTFLYQ